MQVLYEISSFCWFNIFRLGPTWSCSCLRPMSPNRSTGNFCVLKDTLYLVTQSCPILWNSMDCVPPDSSVHGISQARILERVAIPYSDSDLWVLLIKEWVFGNGLLLIQFARDAGMVYVCIGNYPYSAWRWQYILACVTKLFSKYEHLLSPSLPNTELWKHLVFSRTTLGNKLL